MGPVDDAGFVVVPDLELMVLVAGEGFLAVVVPDIPGFVLALPGEEVKLLGTVEVRRAAEVMVDLLFSSSDTDGWDL